MNQRLQLEGMHAATASTTGWIENGGGHGSPCLFCGNPAGVFKPLDQGWAHFVQRLWWCRPCETTWVE